MNKKIALLGAAAVCALLLLGSCVSMMVFDETIPKEQSSVLFFYGIEVTEYNGIAVPYKKNMLGDTQSSWHYVVLPAGTMEFNFDVVYSEPHTDAFGRHSRTNYRGEGHKLTYNFEPNFEYMVMFSIRDRIWGIDIYQWEKMPKAMVGFPEENRIAFLPLKSADGSSENIILE